MLCSRQEGIRSTAPGGIGELTLKPLFADGTSGKAHEELVMQLFGFCRNKPVLIG